MAHYPRHKWLGIQTTTRRYIVGERLYMLLFGVIIIIGLYFDIPNIIYALITVTLIEGITNLRLGPVLNRLPLPLLQTNNQPLQPQHRIRFQFDSRRVWHLVVGTALAVSYIGFFDQLWFFVWFLGFAVAGAGLSGICPVLFLIQSLGFK